jgi:uncharacterized membrane protein YoaK (UPF0700 family)
LARLGQDRSRVFAVTVTAEVALLAVATVVVGLSIRADGTSRDVPVALLAVAMGLQNAVARHLAVPDLTTTVLTMTLTGIASDLRHGERSTALTRRLLAVTSMFAGALIGAGLVLHESSTVALLLGTGVIVVVTGTAWSVGRGLVAEPRR